MNFCDCFYIYVILMGTARAKRRGARAPPSVDSPLLRLFVSPSLSQADAVAEDAKCR